ncbi:MAG: hypothetical protein ABJA66_08505 [Actinomycetota bacterium]
MIKIIITGFLGVVLGVSTFSLLTQKSSCEEDVYGKIVPIGGIVTTTEIDSGEDMPARNKIVVLQRIDCKKCVSAVITDNEGKYIAYLSEGKYQIIIRDCGSNKNKDCIAPNQSDFINVIPKGNPQFDLKLIHNKEDNLITLPKGIIVPSPIQ